MSTERTITLKKRMASSLLNNEKGKPIQFIGSGFINRNPDGVSCYCSPDVAYVDNLLYGLKYDEGEIDVSCTISLDRFNGSRRMWCFGSFIENRTISPHKPKVIDIRNGVYYMKGSYFFLDNWCEKRYFEQIPQRTIFPVYVKVERINTI